MSLFNALRTSVSGMAAQSNALGTISDNIANSGTTGYKQASAQFETVLGVEATSAYESGGVRTDIRYGVSAQGVLDTTTSATDLAIKGNGFFVVGNGTAATYLTRAGSFVPNSDGNLVNAAGFLLQGQKIEADGTTDQALSTVQVTANKLQATPTSTATLTVNLPSTATPLTAAGTVTPNTAVSTASATSTSPASTTVKYTDKTSVTVYDSLGAPVVLDVYFTDVGANSSGADQWQVAAYKQSDASSSGGFPYAHDAVKTGTLTFDATNGSLTGGSPLAVTMGSTSFSMDLSGTTQLASDFSVTTAAANGNPPSTLSGIKVGTDGTLSATYTSGVVIPLYKIPLATVISPDALSSLSGNIYETNGASGNYILQTAGAGGVGTIQSDTLEESTVDIATELSNMITVQRSYEANSKVLQAASDLLSTLDRLQTS